MGRRPGWAEVDSLLFRVAGIPPGPNKRMHWSKLAHWRRHFKQAVAWQAIARRAQVRPPVRITVRYHFDLPRVRDPDNLVAAAKPLIDGLVPHAIPDDSSQVVSQPVAIEVFNDAPRARRGAGRFTEIVVESVAGAVPSQGG